MNAIKCAGMFLIVAFLSAMSYSQDAGAAATRPDTLIFQQGQDGYQGCEDVATDGDEAEQNLLDDRADRGLGMFGDMAGNWTFLRFNDLKIPAGWKIDKADLVLTIKEPSNADKTGIAVHRLTHKLDFAQVCFAYRDLSKKEKWGTTQPSDSGELFPKAGIDYQEKPEAVMESTTDKSEITIDLTAAVRDWIADPTKNTGLLLRPPTDQSVGWFASTQQDQDDRPKLVLHLVRDKP